MRLGLATIAAGASLLAASFTVATPAAAQRLAPEWEVTPHVGLYVHQFSQSHHTHSIFGVRALPVRWGPLALGLNLDWFPDRLNLGPAFGGRAVDMNYLMYTAEVEWRPPTSGGNEVFVGASLGAETAFFGARHEAAGFLPSTTSAPTGALGVGLRFPLEVRSHPLALRLGVRLHWSYAEVFDPAGLDEGRELLGSREISLGVSYPLGRDPGE